MWVNFSTGRNFSPRKISVSHLFLSIGRMHWLPVFCMLFLSLGRYFWTLPCVNCINLHYSRVPHYLPCSCKGVIRTLTTMSISVGKSFPSGIKVDLIQSSSSTKPCDLNEEVDFGSILSKQKSIVFGVSRHHST